MTYGSGVWAPSVTGSLDQVSGAVALGSTTLTRRVTNLSAIWRTEEWRYCGDILVTSQKNTA